jgi:hypothetical protein
MVTLSQSLCGDGGLDGHVHRKPRRNFIDIELGFDFFCERPGLGDFAVKGALYQCGQIRPALSASIWIAAYAGLESTA